MLSNPAIKAARPRPRAYKMFDGRGLYVQVLPSGRRSFRVKYRWRGIERLLTLGAFPELSLPDARARCDAIHEALARGEDPAGARSAGLCFEAAALRWIDHCAPRWSREHRIDVESSFTLHVFPAIGAMPLGEIDAPSILALLRAVEDRGARATARRVRQRISDVYALAISEGQQVSDPAAIVARAMRPPAAAKHHPALLELADARDLLAACERIDVAPAIRLASRFLALTAVRLAAVRGARWDEFEGIDWSGDATAAPIWRVPAARMKLAAEKKGDGTHDHVVPLSAAAVDVLRAARANRGSAPVQLVIDNSFVFAGRTTDRPIGEGAIGALYAGAGFAGRHVPHGWRASFSTIMNERHRSDRAEIDLALAHVPKEKVEAAYNRAAMLDRRRALLDAWARYLLDG